MLYLFQARLIQTDRIDVINDDDNMDGGLKCCSTNWRVAFVLFFYFYLTLESGLIELDRGKFLSKMILFKYLICSLSFV